MPVDAPIFRLPDSTREFRLQLLFPFLQQLLEYASFRMMSPQRLKQLQLHVGVSQFVKGIQSLFDLLPKFLQPAFDLQNLEQMQQRQNPPRFGAQFVNGFCGEILAAPFEPLVITTPGDEHALDQMLRQKDWKVRAHDDLPYNIAQQGRQNAVKWEGYSFKADYSPRCS